MDNSVCSDSRTAIFGQYRDRSRKQRSRHDMSPLPASLACCCWRYPLLTAIHVSSTTGIAWRARKWVGGYAHRMGMVVEPMAMVGWQSGFDHERLHFARSSLSLAGSSFDCISTLFSCRQRLDARLLRALVLSGDLVPPRRCCCLAAVDTSALMMMVSESVSLSRGHNNS